MSEIIYNAIALGEGAVCTQSYELCFKSPKVEIRGIMTHGEYEYISSFLKRTTSMGGVFISKEKGVFPVNYPHGQKLTGEALIENYERHYIQQKIIIEELIGLITGKRIGEEIMHAEVRVAEIICLCGSTKFFKQFQDYNQKFTLEGKIVLSIGCVMRDDDELFNKMSDAEKRLVKSRLDVLHMHKIDVADTVFIIDVNGYIGESTEREVAYAFSRGKKVRYHSRETIEQELRAANSSCGSDDGEPLR